MTIDPSGRLVGLIQEPSLLQLQKSRQIVQQLNQMALHALPEMFDSDYQLFCYKLRRTPFGMVREGVSHRYTMMTLLGLHRLEQNGIPVFADIAGIFDSLVADLGLFSRNDWVKTTGDLGLLLWTCALIQPHRLREIARRVEAKSALVRFAGGRQACTVELAWLLAGISHACLADPARISDLEPLAAETYTRLVRNQGDCGFFGSYARIRSIRGLVRGSIGSFADQVYPIYAFTQFAKAFKNPHAAERALDCALAICNAQGPLGQWSWHYNSETGTVINRFPVFSVHQHGMAPMALLALGETLESDFSPWILKGLNWITDNELAFDMRDSGSHVIWRGIARPEYRKYMNAAREALIKRDHREPHHDLHVLFECRPYELGWLLYAFANLNAVPVGVAVDTSKEVIN